MIENPSRAEWNALNERVVAALEPVLAGAGGSLGPTGQKMSDVALRKFGLTRSRCVQDVTTVVALLHLVGEHDAVVAAADVLTVVPFTGNYDIYEPIRETTALAMRSLILTGADPTRFANRLTFAENGGEAGPVVWTQPLRNRLDGLVFKDNAHDDHSAGAPRIHAHNVTIDVRELVLMWVLGGSASWPRERIEHELNECALELRSLGALPYQS